MKRQKQKSVPNTIKNTIAQSGDPNLKNNKNKTMHNRQNKNTKTINTPKKQKTHQKQKTITPKTIHTPDSPVHHFTPYLHLSITFQFIIIVSVAQHLHLITRSTLAADTEHVR